ncbi:CLUMA_CG008042, isoform A [Clunio marinus]|uniref:CLUMA_CG008042, isoform A n=1 Tax=Clunio marinus TaxID=568069 RepID=A0A1J1I2W3_9DIPT|nr:CLUMA_CG008042, isoform A [Clunio marinus]
MKKKLSKKVERIHIRNHDAILEFRLNSNSYLDTRFKVLFIISFIFKVRNGVILENLHFTSRRQIYIHEKKNLDWGSSCCCLKCLEHCRMDFVFRSS